MSLLCSTINGKRPFDVFCGALATHEYVSHRFYRGQEIVFDRVPVCDRCARKEAVAALVYGYELLPISGVFPEAL